MTNVEMRRRGLLLRQKGGKGGACGGMVGSLGVGSCVAVGFLFSLVEAECQSVV